MIVYDGCASNSLSMLKLVPFVWDAKAVNCSAVVAPAHDHTNAAVSSVELHQSNGRVSAFTMDAIA